MLRKPAYGRIFFEADSGNTAGNTATTDATTTTSTTGTPPSTGESDAVTFTDAQQKEINRLIGNARKEGRTAAEQAAADAETARLAEAKREADIAAGKFKDVEADLTKERDDAKANLDTVTTERDAAYALLEAHATALQEELPKELLDDFPADGSPVERIKWLQQQKKVFDIAKAATGANGQHPRVPATPAAQGQPKPEATSLVSRHAI